MPCNARCAVSAVQCRVHRRAVGVEGHHHLCSSPCTVGAAAWPNAELMKNSMEEWPTTASSCSLRPISHCAGKQGGWWAVVVGRRGVQWAAGTPGVGHEWAGWAG